MVCPRPLVGLMRPPSARSGSSVSSWASSIRRGRYAPLISRLYLFATILAQSVHHFTIKVYFSGVQALHVERGFSDPIKNSSRLQLVFREIKQSQGLSSSTRLPITDNNMVVIWQSFKWPARITACLGQLVLLPTLASFAPLNL